jgi:hypothetical protein
MLLAAIGTPFLGSDAPRAEIQLTHEIFETTLEVL